MSIKKRQNLPQRVYNKLVLWQNQNRDITYVFVEGSKDRAFFLRYMYKEGTKPWPICGKPNIADTLDLIRQKQPYWRNVCAIVDADYWLIAQSSKLSTKNLLYDDRYPDMEIMLMHSESLEDVLQIAFHKCDPEKIHQFAEKLKVKALHLAMNPGYFRLLNYYEDYGINFDEFWKENRRIHFIDNSPLTFNRKNFSNKLKAFCPWISTVDLLAEVKALEADFPLPNDKLCQGKDVISILVEIFPIVYRSEFQKALPKKIGSRFGYTEFDEKLRGAYDSTYLKDTCLFKNIGAWETENERTILDPKKFERSPA